MSISYATLVVLCVSVTAWSCVAPTTAFADGSQDWTVHFQDAKKMAAEQDRDIFMFFTGSDWCPRCKALNKNVFSKGVFLKEATKNYILLKLDFPNDKSTQTAGEISQFTKFKTEYKLIGFPTVFLADSQGKPYAKMVGYADATTAEVYAKQLAHFSAIRKQRDEFFSKAKVVTSVGKAKLLDRAIALIDTELVLEFYADTVKEIMTLDADDEAKLKSKYESKLQISRLQRRLKDIQLKARRGFTEEALKDIEALIDESQSKGEQRQMILCLKAELLFRNDRDASKEVFEAALKLAPETAVGQRIGRILTNEFNYQLQ